MNTEHNGTGPEDLDTLAGEYVLGSLPASQWHAVHERLKHDADLRSAVTAWENRLLELTAIVEPKTPNPRLWSRVSRTLDAQLDGDAKAPRQVAVPWHRRLGVWRGLAGAGLAASLVLATMLLTTSAPRITYMVVLVAPTDQTPGWVVQASDSRRVQLIPLGHGEVPGDKVLQFWTKAEGWQAPVSLGLVKPGAQLSVPLDQLPPLEPSQLFELTLENPGGSTTGRPMGPVQFIGRAVKVI